MKALAFLNKKKSRAALGSDTWQLAVFLFCNDALIYRIWRDSWYFPMGRFRASHVALVTMFALDVCSLKKEKQIESNAVSEEVGADQIPKRELELSGWDTNKWASYYMVPSQVISWQVLQRGWIEQLQDQMHL